MKRISAIAAACAVVTALFVLGVLAADLFSASQSELHVKAGEEVTIVYRAENAELTACGVRYEIAEGFDFVSGEWIFDEDESPAMLMKDISESEDKLEPAVCAFSTPTVLNGDIFALVLKPNANAAAETEIAVTVSYSGTDMENKRETVTVRVILDEASGEQSPGQSDNSDVPGPEKTGSSTVIWIAVAAAAAAAIAVCAVLFLRKKKSK